jgi:hypothetical protein
MEKEQVGVKKLSPAAIFWIIVGVVVAIAIVSSSASGGASSSENSTHPQNYNINSANVSPASQGSEISDYLQGYINYAHEGYLADTATAGLNSNDPTGMMSALIEAINHGNQAVNFISTFTTSPNKHIATMASLLAASENDVIAKQQAILNILRQLSNGDVPTDLSYSAAQLQAAQKQRSDNLVLAFTEAPLLTTDVNSIPQNGTIGPANPTGLLTDEERSSLQTNLQMEFGSDLYSNKDDIFLLMAQEVELLINSSTYADFQTAWKAKLLNTPN